MVNLLRKEIYFSLRFGGWNLDSDDSVRLASSEAHMEEGITVAGRMEKRLHGELGSQKSGGTRPLAMHPNGSGQGGGLAVYPEWASSSRSFFLSLRGLGSQLSATMASAGFLFL